MIAQTFAQPLTPLRLSTDETRPFYEVRQTLSKAIDDVERNGGEIVIAKHGKPVAALLSAAGLYRYREMDRLMAQLLSVLAPNESATDLKSSAELANLLREANSLLAKNGGAHE